MQDLRSNVMKLKTQEKAMQALQTIEELGRKQDNIGQGKSQMEKDYELLEKTEGLGWSRYVFEEIEWRLEDARTDLITLAK